MSDERIFEVVERQDKYYILGFINGLKANRDELLRENEELKKQLANNGIVSTCENCEWFEICPHSYREFDYKNECEKLKKQLEEVTEDYRRMKDNFDSKVDVLTKIAIQQQEFIKYLEDEMEPYLTFYSLTECAIAYDTLKKILNKYKEIIGIKDEIN